MEQQLTGEGRENRGWVLLARSKADALAKEIQRRRNTVTELLTKAEISNQLAGGDSSKKYVRDLLKDIVDRFEKYPDLDDLVSRAKAALDAGDPKPSPPETEPAAPAEKPGTAPAPTTPPKD